MDLRVIVILPLVSAVKPYSSKEIQLEAWLHKALIRLTYRVESQLCNTETIALCNSLQLVDPLIQNARESVDVLTHSVSRKWKVCWEAE